MLPKLWGEARTAAVPFAVALEHYMSSSGSPMGPPPPPRYVSLEDFRARTTPAELNDWCKAKARRASRESTKLAAGDVLRVLYAAEGRCCYCGSLAVEKCPPRAWALVGRRVGTLEHRDPLLRGPARNEPSNLAWCCHWCNTHPLQRIHGATNAGGLYPPPDLADEQWLARGAPVTLRLWHTTRLERLTDRCLHRPVATWIWRQSGLSRRRGTAYRGAGKVDGVYPPRRPPTSP